MSATQRGSSHNPLVAKALRIRQEAEARAIEKRRNEEARKEALREHGRKLDAEAAADRREAARAGITVAELRRNRELGIDLTPSKPVQAESKREHGRKLDQIETCYRQHTPTQQRIVTLDELYEDGTVVWEDDVMVVRNG